MVPEGRGTDDPEHLFGRDSLGGIYIGRTTVHSVYAYDVVVLK